MSSRPKRQSLSTIESSVTRLLVSTKHLLESLTQWARREVDDKFVSDTYVKLGNDFRAAVRAFTAAGIDISDLGDVPQALRLILEAALSQQPSQDSLDRFLPNIRNIIVTLLQNLKVKQSKAKALTQQREMEKERERERERSKGSLREDVEQDDLRHQHDNVDKERLRSRERGVASRVLPPPPSNRTLTRSISSDSGSLSRVASHTSSLAKTSVPSIATTFSPSHNEPSSDSRTTSGALMNAEALAQLQKGNSIQRRASKRFSAYQYAKLTNNLSALGNLSSISSYGERDRVGGDSADTTMELEGSTSVNRTLAVANKSMDSHHSQDAGSASGAETSVDNNNKITIFLRILNRTKKVTVETPLSFNSLRLLFVEKFAYSPGTNAFPEIYVQDPQNHNLTYELEEHLMGADVKEGSVLLLNQPDPQVERLRGLEDKFEQLSLKLEDVSNHVVGEIKCLILLLPPPSQQQVSTADVTPKGNEVKKYPLTAADLSEIRSIQQEIRFIGQIHSEGKKSLVSTIEQALESISELKVSSMTSSKSSNRNYMDSCHAKLSEESDGLLTKVDDLQDIMEALRKDVAQRGVRVGESQLKLTYKEINDAKGRLMAMKDYIQTEKVNWKRIWERELDTVCEEQQFFNLQDDLTNDLEEDINRIEETYSLIEQCSLEQSKQSGIKRNKFMANLYIPEPGESLHSMKDAVLSEVSTVIPNHESRLEAIEKAERIREKERAMMKMTKFQSELENFVDDSKLKKSGGISEVERMRRQRDEENLKSSLGAF